MRVERIVFSFDAIFEITRAKPPGGKQENGELGPLNGIKF